MLSGRGRAFRWNAAASLGGSPKLDFLPQRLEARIRFDILETSESVWGIVVDVRMLRDPDTQPLHGPIDIMPTGIELRDHAGTVVGIFQLIGSDCPVCIAFAPRRVKRKRQRLLAPFGIGLPPPRAAGLEKTFTALLAAKPFFLPPEERVGGCLEQFRCALRHFFIGQWRVDRSAQSLDRHVERHLVLPIVERVAHQKHAGVVVGLNVIVPSSGGV